MTINDHLSLLPGVLPYHLKVRDYFRQQPATWDFFAAARTKEEQLAAFKMELLKNTYQFQRGSDGRLYDKIDRAREQLGLGALPVTAYQAQYTSDPGMNASIVYLDQEAHLVFSGPILQRLNEEELLALIAHELTHVRLYSVLNGDLEVADRIVSSIANSYQGFRPSTPGDGRPSLSSAAPEYETARLFRLYTEIYCDRGAYTVLGDAGPVITMLVKIATGLTNVNADSYAQQAEAIFSAAPGTQSTTPTHPENFIRTRALQLWHQQKEAAGPAISRMIEGTADLDRLDIFSQKELADHTRDFLLQYLQPSWFHTPLVKSLLRQFFPTLTWDPPRTGAPTDVSAEGNGPIRDRLATMIAAAHPGIRDYFSYLLLDFALADPSLEMVPSGHAFRFAEEMHLSEVYDPIYKKELQISDKKWPQHRQQALADGAAANLPATSATGPTEE